jgi:protein-S-isoprenylcysteine O-methyltransferase Ste14
MALAVLFAVPPFYLLKRLGKPKQGAEYFATTQVVDSGVYAVVRHPQYLGYILLVFGFCCIDPHWISCVLAVFASVFFHLQAFHEEGYCRERFGQQYDSYSNNVPRFNFVLGFYRKIHLNRGHTR